MRGEIGTENTFGFKSKVPFFTERFPSTLQQL
jgi:hypothetical protein